MGFRILTGGMSRAIMGIMTNDQNKGYWFQRGLADAQRDRSPRFKKRGSVIYAVGEWPENNDTSEQDAGEAYLAGYNGYFQ